MNTMDEFQQLAKHYAAMYDDELLQLATDFEDLTSVAREALSAELKHRNLSLDADASEVQDPDVKAADAGPIDLQEISHIAQYNSMWAGPSRHFETSEETVMASMALDDANISNWVYNPGGNKFDVRNTQLRFLPKDEDRASAVLAQPVSPDIRDRYAETLALGDFQVPDCPVCGTPDPLLESADPVNEWFCESCAHQWKEA